MFETNQDKRQLLGYDTAQTGKYLVWMTVSTFYTEDEGKTLLPTYLPSRLCSVISQQTTITNLHSTMKTSEVL